MCRSLYWAFLVLLCSNDDLYIFSMFFMLICVEKPWKSTRIELRSWKSVKKWSPAGSGHDFVSPRAPRSIFWGPGVAQGAWGGLGREWSLLLRESITQWTTGEGDKDMSFGAPCQWSERYRILDLLTWGATCQSCELLICWLGAPYVNCLIILTN